MFIHITSLSWDVELLIRSKSSCCTGHARTNICIIVGKQYLIDYQHIINKNNNKNKMVLFDDPPQYDYREREKRGN